MVAQSIANQPKAIIFTHLGNLEYKKDLIIGSNERNKVVRKYKKIISKYLKCNIEKTIVPIVYMYVDWAIKNVSLEKWATKNFHIDPFLKAEENVLFGILKDAEQAAKDELGLSNSRTAIFHRVGIDELIALLNELISIDLDLIQYLRGPGPMYKLTYDSPKFIEAIIRLARGSTPHLAWHPIVRFDEDTDPNPLSINRLLATYAKITHQSPYFFFSGIYGTFDEPYDPINDHAVRVHWFTNEESKLDEEKIRTFLADLNELGATQMGVSAPYYSGNLKYLLDNSRPINNPARKSPQVISGAGLIMSPRAIELLPPFMNFGTNIVWVDDHLKRRLHEALLDIGNNDLESVGDAKFKQDRHPYPPGITERNLEWAKNEYFDRLLGGCIFRRLITNLDGTPTEYSSLISNIVQYRLTKDKWSAKYKKAIRKDMLNQASGRYDKVLTCWTSSEFVGYLSHEWANDKKRKPTHKTNMCDTIVENALNYVDLVFAWPIFVRAIKRLRFAGHEWLFEAVK